ncbi:MAG: hypothetical protein M3357_14040 [Actinomycetota bacterium]|jgi:hypothetical protein|nr:hypothetical protein [Actinomycetota bacterium]
MAGEAKANDENVVITERSHDQAAEGGREQADEALGWPPGKRGAEPDVADPEEAGIVDQQGAALREGRTEP